MNELDAVTSARTLVVPIANTLSDMYTAKVKKKAGDYKRVKNL